MTASRGPLMMSQVRRMREMRAAGLEYGEIAAGLGRSRTTVAKYARDVERDRSGLACAQISRARMEARARRYTAFVERVAAFVPLLGGAQ